MDTATSSLRRTLPGRFYTDPDLFGQERASIFGAAWVCVGRADELDGPGRFLRADVAGESVLVVRADDGSLSAVLNVCRHRGARLCLEGEGQLGRVVRCPYHGWTYGRDGRLLAAPNFREMPDLVKADYGLHAVGVAEWCGYAWVNLEPGAAPIQSQIDPQLRRRLGDSSMLGRYRPDELVLAHRETYDVAANWKTLVENFTECYHCPTLHPELTERIPEFSSGYGTVTGGAGHGAALADGLDGFSWSGRSTGPALPGLDPGDERCFHGVILLPNVFMILVPDHVAFYRLDPVAVDRTVVVCDWLFHPSAVAGAGFDAGDAVRILDVTNRQDFEACERCQLGMRSRSFSGGGVLVPAEHLISEFHDYVRQAAEPAGS